MKKIYFLFIFIVLTAESCSNDNTKNDNTKNVVYKYKDTLVSPYEELVDPATAPSSNLAGYKEVITYITSEEVCYNRGWIDNFDCPSNLVIGDINTDGHLDIFLDGESPENQSANYSNGKGNTMFINQGDGTFAEKSTSLHRQPGHVWGPPTEMFSSIGDVNGDGMPDVAGHTFGYNFFIKGTSDLSFDISDKLNRVNFTAKGDHGEEAYIYDYNNDGIRDIIFLRGGSSTYLKKGGGGIYLGSPSKDPNNPVSFSSNDIIFTHIGDESCYPELDSSKVHLYECKNGNAFSNSLVSGLQILGDITGDGYPELVRTNAGAVEGAPSGFLIYVSNGEFKYVAHILQDLGYEHRIFSFKTHDNAWNMITVNLDDHLVNHYTFNVTYDARTFSVNRHNISPPSGLPSYFVDLNKDGYADVLLRKESEIYYHLGKTSNFSSFGAAKFHIGNIDGDAMDHRGSFKTADFNNDGYDDVAIIRRVDFKVKLFVYLSKTITE